LFRFGVSFFLLAVKIAASVPLDSSYFLMVGFCNLYILLSPERRLDVPGSIICSRSAWLMYYLFLVSVSRLCDFFSCFCGLRPPSRPLLLVSVNERKSALSHASIPVSGFLEAGVSPPHVHGCLSSFNPNPPPLERLF